MAYLFSSESVSERHPDEAAGQINDALLDQFLAYNEDARCAIETFNTTDQVMIMGEVRSKEYADLQTIAHRTINKIGYTKAEYRFGGNSCGVLFAIHEQSDDINRGVDNGDAENRGAGDQDMMFGYACDRTDNYMPVTLDLTHLLVITLTDIRKEGKQMTYLRPDSKGQVTMEYSDDNIPQRIDTIVVSTQHDDFIKPADDSHEAQSRADRGTVEQIHKNVLEIFMPRVKVQITSEEVFVSLNDNVKYLVSPIGKLVVGDPHGGTGLTGHKIIVNTYGGKGGYGGGALSDKDSGKVNHSAAYAVRYIAKNMVAADLSNEILVQLAHATGVAEPVSIYVNTYGRSYVRATGGEIAEMVERPSDLRPRAIEKILKLCQPVYLETAAYGHMGCRGEVAKKTSGSRYREEKAVDIELFTWEKLDRVKGIKKTFGL